jgi:hypothetical protein
MKIDIEIAKKVLSTIDSGLTSGVGNPVPGQMCVEAAVCYALGLPHGDDPGCVSQALRSLKITLNDAVWSSDSARAQGLRRLGLAQLGSKDTLNEVEFAEKVSLLVLNTSVADALRLSAKGNSSILQHAEACAAAKNLDAASYAARYAARQRRQRRHAASYAASAAATPPAPPATPPAPPARQLRRQRQLRRPRRQRASYASYAASAASAASYASYAASAASDAVLIKFAEGVVQILIEMKAPGVQWLPLTEK